MESNKIDTIKSRIQDIARLANDKGATEGERNAASDMLNKLLVKYGLKLEDVLEQDVPKIHFHFVYTENWERDLLYQIACCVTDRDLDFYTPKDKRKLKSNQKPCWLDLTQVEYLEISHLYPQYTNAYREQLKLFHSAFIQANDLGVKANGESKPLTKEERAQLRKLMAMAQSLGSAGVARSSLLLSEGE